MQFMKTEGTSELVEALTGALTAALKHNLKVLWLVPGGSNISVVVEAMATIPKKDTHRLVVMLSDERYGQIGHEDSNYHQIMQAGFLPYEANFIQTLSNSPLVETVDYTVKIIEKLLKECGAIVGFFGMGSDGHTAGILPHSPAVDSDNLVVAYEAGQFTRITLTPKVLSHVTVAAVGAFGTEKKSALLNLRDKTLPLQDQPAQLLKTIPSVMVFNDQIGDEE
jgi:6-phosphogluconolactonase/glucosamine-6-phosphate isomerase/deaminase